MANHRLEDLVVFQLFQEIIETDHNIPHRFDRANRRSDEFDFGIAVRVEEGGGLAEDGGGEERPDSSLYTFL